MPQKNYYVIITMFIAVAKFSLCLPSKFQHIVWLVSVVWKSQVCDWLSVCLAPLKAVLLCFTFLWTDFQRLSKFLCELFTQILSSITQPCSLWTLPSGAGSSPACCTVWWSMIRHPCVTWKSCAVHSYRRTRQDAVEHTSHSTGTSTVLHRISCPSHAPRIRCQYL